ncbi:hypothetical protein ACIRRH_11230 [Kitasatospora sp. NPDC101235]|uniref:hypothetical protein n=1 Tax=Kitasatospora sp. NPDC101235 TaxID=3364101 RepID=UPI003822DD2D
MVIDSRLKAVYDGRSGTDPEHQRMVDQLTASFGPEEAEALVEGACTLVYIYMNWLRSAFEQHEEDVVERAVPTLVATMRMMPRTFPPEVIPTMAGLLIAAGTGLSPNLWRAQYGAWTKEEMNPLEATAVLLAEYINRISGNGHDFATKLVTDVLSEADGD